MRFLSPKTLHELMALIHTYNGSTILAGGTDLLVRIRRERIYPETIISLEALGWNAIRRTRNSVEIGSMVTAAQLSACDCPELGVLSCAASQVGGAQIRNMATIGGNVVNASPAADMALALVALDADATIVGPKGERRIHLHDFFRGPGQTILSNEEIVRSFHIPVNHKISEHWFRKVGPRSRHFISRVALAAVVTGIKDRISSIRMALGSVAPVPMRAKHTERYLETSERIGIKEIETAARLASTEDCKPISDHRSSEEYRRRIVYNIVKEFLWECAG